MFKKIFELSYDSLFMLFIFVEQKKVVPPHTFVLELRNL